MHIKEGHTTEHFSFNMSASRLLVCIYICTCIWLANTEEINIANNGISINIKLATEAFELSVKQGGIEKLKGEIGVGMVKTGLQLCSGVENCYEIGQSRLHVLTHIDNGFTIFWTTKDINTKFEDCFELGDRHWYGGPERFEQYWPLEKLNLTDFANVLQEDQWGSVIEPYWLNSAGAYIFVDDKVPLFINQNTPSTKGKVCFSAKSVAPYPARTKVVLHYTIASTENAKEGHLHAVKHFLGKPTGHPNFKIIERPIWSTWARYKRNVNDSAIVSFAQEIFDNGYSDGQFEIDDDWEDCYGALTFRASRFGDINNSVKKIKSMNFRVSLWVHPFVNLNCEKYRNIGRKYDFFVKNVDGSDLTHWWNSEKYQALYLDFTKPEVRMWFTQRLRKIKEEHQIDSFKFDAGETTWAPQVSVLQGDVDTMPNNIAVDYVKMCATFGDLVEIRAGWRTQNLPVLVRMIDKDSIWGAKNGLYTLITTLLQMNMNGYTLVLPDMVGGNGYNGAPTPELFIRWLQANVFMPSIQFSYVPWDYALTEFNVTDISKNMVALHQKYAKYIEKQMNNSIEKGYPVNAPIWWVDPTDVTAQKEDTEFLLGEDLLAAPVIVEGAKTRNIYLPKGTWVDGNDGTVHDGPKMIENYAAPIDVLPYFFRYGSDADLRNGAVAIWPITSNVILFAVVFVLGKDLF